MLRHHIRGERGGIIADLDLEIAACVTGIERTDQRENRVDDRLEAGQPGKIESDLSAGGREIENAIFRQSRPQRIGITVVKTEAVAMQGIGDLIPIRGELREVRAHVLAV